MEDDALHLADVCVRFFGADGAGISVPCCAYVLHRESPLFRDMVGAELSGTLKRTADGRRVVELRNDRLDAGPVRDALVAAHRQGAPGRWPWDRVWAAARASEYLQLPAAGLVEVLAALATHFPEGEPLATPRTPRDASPDAPAGTPVASPDAPAGTPDASPVTPAGGQDRGDRGDRLRSNRCVALVDAFPADTFWDIDHRILAGFAARLGEAVRAAAMADEDAAAPRVMRAAAFLWRVRQSRECVAVLRSVSARAAVRWVKDTNARVLAGDADLSELRETCDVAGMRAPPALVARGLPTGGPESLRVMGRWDGRHVYPPEWMLVATNGGPVDPGSALAPLTFVEQAVFAGPGHGAHVGFFLRAGWLGALESASGIRLDTHGECEWRGGVATGTYLYARITLPAEHPVVAGGDDDPESYDVAFFFFRADGGGLLTEWVASAPAGTIVEARCTVPLSYGYVMCVPNTYACFCAMDERPTGGRTRG